MQNRFLIAIGIIIIVALLFMARFIKGGSSRLDDDKGFVRKGVSITVETYLKEAESFIEKGSLLEAQEIYKKLLDMSLSSSEMQIVQQDLEKVNIDILLSGVRIEGSQIYEVQPKDSLYNIAKKFKTTVDAIAKANNIKGTIIHPGMKLRILKGTFSIFVDKSQNILILKFNDEVVKTYNVSTGKNNSTPTGTYSIVNKLKDPVWYKDGKAIPPTSPKNILGTRWLGFNIPTYGIHGTTAPQDIGKQITEGCIRMRNNEVEELYSLVPTGVVVTIVD